MDEDTSFLQRNEVLRDLIFNTTSRRKQTLLDILAVLKELCRAKHMQIELETHVNEENFFKAFQVLSEYLQLLDSLSELSTIEEMSRGVEALLTYIADLAGKSSTEVGFTFIGSMPRL